MAPYKRGQVLVPLPPPLICLESFARADLSRPGSRADGAVYFWEESKTLTGASSPAPKCEFHARRPTRGAAWEKWSDLALWDFDREHRSQPPRRSRNAFEARETRRPKGGLAQVRGGNSPCVGPHPKVTQTQTQRRRSIKMPCKLRRNAASARQ